MRVENTGVRILCVAFVKFKTVPEETLRKAAGRVDIRTEMHFIMNNEDYY